MPVERVQNTEEALLQERSSRGRLFQLDALRGLAAFCVIWYHLRQAFPSARSHNPILVVFTSGHQAVDLFFVLSGYVLSMPFWLGKQAPYPRYLLRRFFRIYVPYFVAMLLAWACAYHFLYRHLPLTSWFQKTWQTPLTLGLFVQSVFMSTSPAINTAFWSLRIEAEFSILLPLFCWLVLRLRTVPILLLSIASFVSGMYVADEDWSGRLMHFPMFFVGLLLSLHAKQLASLWQRLPPVAHWGLLLVAGILYFRVLPVGSNAQDGLTVVGASLVILCSLHSTRIAQLLRHALPEYLGRISFSLYLVHGTVLFACLDMLYGHVPTPVIGVIYGVCCMGLAHLFCIAVEEPAMRLGKRLTTSLSRELDPART
jgi:peptidoglycan/LPS O-acetylase OafA/YrhL